jgi:Putative inner membrane exporter, YdcZ
VRRFGSSAESDPRKGHTPDAYHSAPRFPPNCSGGQHRHSAGAECKLTERHALSSVVGLHELRRRLGLHGSARPCGSRPSALRQRSGRIPWWAWSGGLFGAIFIGLGIFLVPQMGAATFLALLVTGQMLGSIIFDHFGWLGLTQRPVDAPRLLGVALFIEGVVLIRR